MKKKIIWIFVSIMILAIAIWIIVSIYNNQQKIIENQKKEIEKAQKDLLETKQLYSTAAHIRDSLNAINILLSKYRALTDAMSYRDSVRIPLRFNIGDVVMLKRDSSRVVIKDILIGGGKFEHYIKYQVLYRDNTTETISPELIYDKK